MPSNTLYANVRPATDADRRTALGVFVEAFAADPFAAWLFPDPADANRTGFYRSLIDHPSGQLYLAGRREGAALWLTLSPGELPDGTRADEPRPDPGTDRLAVLGDRLARRHPHEHSHLYLWCMGVVAARQGAGLGAAMLRHRLELADAEALPAYLEASSPRSRSFYLRFGFEDYGDPIRVADAPPLWPMYRPAR